MRTPHTDKKLTIYTHSLSLSLSLSLLMFKHFRIIEVSIGAILLEWIALPELQLQYQYACMQYAIWHGKTLVSSNCKVMEVKETAPVMELEETAPVKEEEEECHHCHPKITKETTNCELAELYSEASTKCNSRFGRICGESVMLSISCTTDISLQGFKFFSR